MNKKVSFLRIIILLVTSCVFSSQLYAQEAEVPLGSSDVETENASPAAIGQSLQDPSGEVGADQEPNPLDKGQGNFKIYGLLAHVWDAQRYANH